MHSSRGRRQCREALLELGQGVRGARLGPTRRRAVSAGGLGRPAPTSRADVQGEGQIPISDTNLQATHIEKPQILYFGALFIALSRGLARAFRGSERQTYESNGGLILG